MKVSLLLISIAIFFTISGCNTYKEYDEESFSNYTWEPRKMIEFKPKIEDNSKLYSLGFGIRLVHGLKRSNIKVEVKSTSPSGKTETVEYEFKLVNSEGEFIGTCAGDLCDLEAIVAMDIKFEEPGEYTYEVSHNQSGPIIGVMALGLIIDEN